MKRIFYYKILTLCLIFTLFSSCLRLEGEDDETAPTITITNPEVWDKDTTTLPTVNTSTPTTQACSLDFTNFDPGDASNELLNIIYSPTVSIPINITATDKNLKYLVVNIYKQEDLDGIDVTNMPEPLQYKSTDGIISETWTPTLSGTEGGYFFIISAIDDYDNEKCYFMVVGVISDISGLTP